MRILFVTSSRVGDAVLSTAALGHLLDRYPGARITIACGPLAAPLFAHVPGLERIIVLRKGKWGRHWLALWAATAGHWWDMVVDLRGSAIAWLVPTLSRRVQHSRRSRAQRLGILLPHRLVELAKVLGIAAPPAPRVWIGPEEEAAALRLVPQGSLVLGLGPTANWIAKTWPAENFVALGRRLTAPGGPLPGARIAVFGAAEERALAAPVVGSFPDCIDLIGRTDLVTAAACLARCALFVGNDSGLMHLAAAAGTPTLGLFGPSPPNEYAPWGKHAAFVTTPIPFPDIFPPGFDHLNTGSLMTTLTVDAAEAGARDLLSRWPHPWPHPWH